MLPRILNYKTMPSPVGPLRLIASERGLCAVLFHDGETTRLPTDAALLPQERHAGLARAQRQLEEYFAGKRRAFDLRLDLRGTVFQIRAWRELQTIPYGQTLSYAEQARRLGDVKKARAVGLANARNPIPVIIPCHRVIGASGALTGFSGGLALKEFLLRHESAAA